MAREKILSVGFYITGEDLEYVDLGSDQSLLDADIIVFQPGLGSRIRPNSNVYRRERQEHWKRELADALAAGKTVLILLVKPQQGRAEDGEEINSYSTIPFPSLNFIPASGSQMRPKGNLRYLDDYWRSFSTCSRFEGYLDGDFSEADVILKTDSGDKTIGAALQRGSGTLILAPPLVPPLGLANSEAVVTFRLRLSRSLVEVHRAARRGKGSTPPPDWSSDPAYRLEREDELEVAIQVTSSKIEALQAEQRKLGDELKDVVALRRLLYEQGNQLEEAILDALKLFGFDAEPYQDADSEFDSVFKSPEGRFLGEAEGKDKRPIHINKLRQLRLNLDEDFARDEVEEYAKGVLFGNPHRLRPLNKRPGDFTAKCYTSAKHSKIALVRTVDMFEPARYLTENEDAEYARLCRLAIQRCEGEVVVFPPPPSG